MTTPIRVEKASAGIAVLLLIVVLGVVLVWPKSIGGSTCGSSYGVGSDVCISGTTYSPYQFSGQLNISANPDLSKPFTTIGVGATAYPAPGSCSSYPTAVRGACMQYSISSDIAQQLFINKVPAAALPSGPGNGFGTIYVKAYDTGDANVTPSYFTVTLRNCTSVRTGTPQPCVGGGAPQGVNGYWYYVQSVDPYSLPVTTIYAQPSTTTVSNPTTTIGGLTTITPTTTIAAGGGKMQPSVVAQIFNPIISAINSLLSGIGIRFTPLS